MPVFADQTGRSVDIKDVPKRIISVVPSQTELLFDLGLNDEVIAITKFCVHPEKWFREKTRIGGTKNLNIEKIRDLKPDLVIANKEENVKEQIEEIEKFCPVWISDVKTIDEALSMIQSLGSVTGKAEKALELAKAIKDSLPEKKTNGIPACYLIWRDPFMTVGGDTFISEMMAVAGFQNIYADQMRYPELSAGSPGTSKAQVILLSSEPYPFNQTDLLEFMEKYPDKKFILVDGEMFSWYGSRMVKAAAYLRQLVDRVEPVDKIDR